MDAFSPTFLFLSIWFLFMHIHLHSVRRASALSSAGLAKAGGETPSLRKRLPSSIKNLLSRLGEALPSRAGKGLEEWLAEEGDGVSPAYFQGLRCASALVAALPALPLGKFSLPLTPALLVLGYNLPVFLLKRKSRLRRGRIARDLPEVVDLMSVLCYSGESLARALQYSTKACVHPHSRRELESILDRIKLGESTAEALRHASGHPCRELRRLSRTLLRAEEHGAPVAEILEGLASEFRSGRRAKERLRASRASVLVLFPLVFLILPSFLLLTVGGMILGYAL